MVFVLGRAQCVRNAMVLCGLAGLGIVPVASAKTLCVNPAGTSGCYTSIGAAVAAAAAGDQINIGTGQYAEDVVVTKPLSLVGAGAGSTIINAKGLANGVYVDGLDNGGLSDVLVTGLTVTNANFEGILVTNTVNSLISNNHVANNDQSLNYAASTCAGQPAFETSEGDDCGEGIHLVGAFAVTVANNEVDLNAGGILLSDETGETAENVITGNSVHDNALDCGVTLASHPPSPQAASKLPYGVIANTIIGNNVSRNGLIGQGAGVGIFAAGPGNLAYQNQVIGNVLENNGLPGVTILYAAPAEAPERDRDHRQLYFRQRRGHPGRHHAGHGGHQHLRSGAGLRDADYGKHHRERGDWSGGEQPRRDGGAPEQPGGRWSGRGQPR